MTKEITVFTTVSHSYKFASEFKLGLRMFKDAFPEGTSFLIAEENTVAALRNLLKERIGKTGGYVFVVKEPAVLIGKEAAAEMLRIMEAYPEISCVLPSDIKGFRKGASPHYLTMRGFENFAASLYDPVSALSPYDGRDPWMFLIGASFLQSLEMPDDPMDIPALLEPERVCISLNAYIHQFVDYFKETRADVLPYVPASIGSLLDIGCTRGYFGESVKKERGCRVVGVEINPYEAEEARSRLDQVIVGDILKVETGEKFDCVTCLDVLEHFVELEDFLQKVKTLLYDSGYLVLSVPNVGHWSVVDDLIAGRWDYVPVGTVCISHVRFFTKATIENLLKENGFTIVATGAEDILPPEPFLKSIALMRDAGMDVDEKSLTALRYYIVAQKTPAQKEYS